MPYHGCTSAKGAKKNYKVKVATLVIEYTGHNCARGDGCHMQDSGRASVVGNPAGKQTVRLSLQDKNGNSLHSATVSIKGSTVLSGLPVDTYVRVHDLAGNLLSTVQVHTSCFAKQWKSIQLDRPHYPTGWAGWRHPG